MRFIFTPDGTAVNVNHIVTIFVAESRHPEGFVVRCSTTLLNGEYVTQGAMLTLSPPLPGREAAQVFLDAVVKDIINPRSTSAPDPDMP